MNIIIGSDFMSKYISNVVNFQEYKEKKKKLKYQGLRGFEPSLHPSPSCRLSGSLKFLN